MKNSVAITFWLAFLLPTWALAQNQKKDSRSRPQATQIPAHTTNLVSAGNQLTLQAALEILQRVQEQATSLNKTVSLAVVDASGQTILLTKGDGVGPHNREAARRKAFTALSTKTNTLALSRNAKANPDTQNLAHLPELLLLGGGVPLWHKGQVIGGLGVAGGGGPENDHQIATSAALPHAGITTH